MFQLEKSHDATALLREMTRGYQRQRSVSYDQRIDTGLGTSVVARWEELQPSTFTYRIRGAASAIVIGRQRWDRERGKSWEKSTTLQSKTLIPLWGTLKGLTNARLVGQTRQRVEITFVGADRAYPAWFRVVAARGTLRVLHVQMTAAAHFMTARYRTWNTQIRIKPPKVAR